MNDWVAWPECGGAGAPVRNIASGVGDTRQEPLYQSSPCPKAVLSSPTLSWFWHISPLCQKPRVLELKGATDSKCSIPFLLQVRKLRQGHTASQWEHQGQSPSLHPCWELRVGRGRAHLVVGPEANHFLCLPSQASSLHPAMKDMGWFHQSRLGGRLGR